MSDLHGDLSLLDPLSCEVCVVAGDFARLEGRSPERIRAQAEWIRREFFQAVSAFPGTTFVMTPGNHDMCLDPKFQEAGFNWSIDWPSNVRMLIDEKAEVGGLTFYGTPWVPIISRTWGFEAEPDELERRFQKIPGGIDVLITHAPPRLPGKFCDVSLARGKDSRQFGSPELAAAISEKKPRYAFCGHIHTGDHRRLMCESSTVVNVSRLDERYEEAFRPFVADVPVRHA